MGAPYFYDYINYAESSYTPNYVHVEGTGAYQYYKRYLTQTLLSEFVFTGIPDRWSHNLFRYAIMIGGYAAVFDTPEYGIIYQPCTLGGYDLYYEPKRAIVANPLLANVHDMVIGDECELIQMQPDYGGAGDIIRKYSGQLAIAQGSLESALNNAKIGYAFAASGKAEAESWKKMVDQLWSGSPAVFYNPAIKKNEGSQLGQLLLPDVGSNYIADKLLKDMETIKSDFKREIGIRSTPPEKGERLISAEVYAYNNGAETLADLWLDTLRTSINRVNAHYNLNLGVMLRGECVSDASRDVPKSPDSFGRLDTTGGS